MPPLPSFISSAYLARSPNVAADRLVNLYPETVETTKGKNVAAYYGTPGLRLEYTLEGSGGIRGLWTTSRSERVFAVRGSFLYELFANGTSVRRGVIGSSGRPISMADNGIQMLMVDGVGGHILSLATNIVTKVTDPDFPSSAQTRFLDGYFLLLERGTGRFYVTGLYEGTDVDSLDFATAEGSSDNIVALLVDHREVWLLGTSTIEVWYNSGNADFPFDRIQGAFIEYGCGAPFSVANLDNTVYWLGSDIRGQHIIFKAAGYQPQRISTHAIEWAISQYSASSRANARAYAYQTAGHSFYAINFAEATWVYDAATGLWHERASLSPDGTFGRHRGQCYTAGFGKNLVGDYADGRVYSLDPETYTDDGTALKRLRACPHFAGEELQRLFFNEFQLDLEAGVGLDSGLEPGTAPQLMLRWSDDGGHSWSPERWMSAGEIGQTRYRALWNRLGSSRDRVFEVSQTDPVKTVWINARVGVKGGRS